MSKPEHPHTIQHRNIKKVVRALADLCFGSKNEPKWGVAWLAIVNSLTAKDGLDWMALRLEPLPEVGQAALDTQRLDWMIAKDARLAHSRDGDVCVVWIPDNSDESGGDYKPVEGFPLKPYTTNRAAIDAAMTVLP